MDITTTLEKGSGCFLLDPPRLSSSVTCEYDGATVSTIKIIAAPSKKAKGPSPSLRETLWLPAAPHTSAKRSAAAGSRVPPLGSVRWLTSFHTCVRGNPKAHYQFLTSISHYTPGWCSGLSDGQIWASGLVKSRSTCKIAIESKSLTIIWNWEDF